MKTSDHLTNVTVSFPATGAATVNVYVQAWHWKAGNTVVVAPGTSDADLVRVDGQWLIAKEKLAIVGAVIAPPPPPPAAK